MHNTGVHDLWMYNIIASVKSPKGYNHESDN